MSSASFHLSLLRTTRPINLIWYMLLLIALYNLVKLLSCVAYGCIINHANFPLSFHCISFSIIGRHGSTSLSLSFGLNWSFLCIAGTWKNFRSLRRGWQMQEETRLQRSTFMEYRVFAFMHYYWICGAQHLALCDMKPQLSGLDHFIQSSKNKLLSSSKHALYL